MPGWHLAQLNLLLARWAPDSAEMAEFYAQVPTMNVLAEPAPASCGDLPMTEEIPCCWRIFPCGRASRR